MKHRLSSFHICIVLFTLLAACAPQISQPTATAAPSVVPVAAAGPEMKLGQTWQYADGSLLVPVPAGPFTMGGSEADNPQHTVTLSGFWIYTTKVTNQQFARCVQAGTCTAPDAKDDPGYAAVSTADNTAPASLDVSGNSVNVETGSANEPVVGVTWDQASAYCGFVHARLPTEAEWEKTARGPDANVYPWGADAPSCDLLNFNKCVGRTTNVVSYPQGASYYQALDMEGNAFEWVADRYDPAYYSSAPAQDPTGPEAGQDRSVRSSSYASTPDLIPAATRFHEDPAKHRRDLGFRCVVEDPAYFAPFCQGVVVTGLNGPPPPKGSCPPAYIHSEPVCLPGKVPGEIVTFGPESPPPGSGVSGDIGGCTFSSTGPGKGIKWVCEPPKSPPGGTFYFTDVCSVSGTEGCVAGYDYDPATKSCKPKAGTSTSAVCLPGYNYDPATQCCSAVPGSIGPYAPCPAGFPYWKDTNKCTRVVTVSTSLVPGDCTNKQNPPGENPPLQPPPCGPNDPNCQP